MAPSRRTRPALDQVRDPVPGQAEHPRDRGVDPFAVKPSGTSTTFCSATRDGAPIMAIVIAGAPATAMPLAGDADVLDDGQDHDHDRGRGDAHVGHVEDRPVRQLEEVDHVAAERTGRPEQPVDQVAADPGTQQTQGDRPAGMAELRHQSDDHESQHADRRDREDVGEVLTLAEGGARVPDQPQRQQAAEQPDRLRGSSRLTAMILVTMSSVRPATATTAKTNRSRVEPDVAERLRCGYRRSSRCLQVTHSVARGNACRRPLPIGWPQLSQLP